MAKDDLFIPHGVFLTCDKGAAVMTLKATPKKHNLYALSIATESDNVPLVNIPCFGICSINGSACMPVAPQWKSVHSGAQKVLGKAPLISTSYCKCQKGGNIKIFLDRKAAEAALEDDKKSRVDGIPWLDGAIGNALLGPVGIIVNKAYGSDDVNEGIGRGFRKGLKGTWNFLSDDMWKADTWKGMGKMAAVGVVGYGGAIIPGYGPTQRLQDFDKTFGTELNQTHEAIGNAISSTWDEKVLNGTAAERSELAGQTAEMVLEAIVGSKGAGAVAKGSMAGAKMALGAERVAEIAESIAKLRQAVKLENLAAKVKGIFKVGERTDEIFLSLKGELVNLKGIIVDKAFPYLKRSKADTEVLRKAFQSTEKKKFLDYLLKDEAALKKKGLTDSDIARMKDGLNPKGYDVHHKYPLDDSGTNKMDNLVLIKNDPYHKSLTVYQNSVTKDLLPGETKIITWYTMSGSVYP